MTTNIDQIQVGRSYTWMPDGTPPTYPIEVTSVAGPEDHNMIGFDILISSGYDDAGKLIIVRSPRFSNVLHFKQYATPSWTRFGTGINPVILAIVALVAGYIILRR